MFPVTTFIILIVSNAYITVIKRHKIILNGVLVCETLTLSLSACEYTVSTPMNTLL